MKTNENLRSKEEKKGSNQKKVAMFSISCVVLLLMATLLVQGFSLSKKIDSAKAREKAIESQIEAEHERTKEIEETEEYMKTPEYVEEAARDNGLLKDNQIIFKEVK